MADHLLGRILVGTLRNTINGWEVSSRPLSGDDLADLPPVYQSCGEAMLKAMAEGGASAAHKVLMAQARELPDLFKGFLCLDPGRYKSTWHLDELLEAEFPEQTFTLPGLLPTGLAVLAARPKIGKSWLAVQMAWAVGSGGDLWGARVPSGRVLYLALEDSPRRLKERLRQQGARAGANVWFEFGWPAFDRDGLTKLLEEIEREHFALVVVDTLQRALGSIDTNKQAEMAVHLGMLQSCAMQHSMTVLLIDHHRKLGGLVEGDPIEDLLGATGKAGVIDVAMGLYRERGSRDAVLKITGRDIDERELALRFGANTGLWECLGEAADVVAGQQEQAVLTAINKLGAPSHQEIADTLQQDRGNCFRRVQALLEKGAIRRIDGRPARFMLKEP